ncbi:hypothetical protein GXW82_04195 [Streptacidiphilus sp. 4-A2]|nr:hypothetical protein [Streptacidiphilus sp. 4-A2]
MQRSAAGRAGPGPGRRSAAAAPDPHGRGPRLLRRLRALGGILPPATELFRDPAALAALHAWAAVAEPALCMTTVNHYLLCLGSIVQLAPDHGPLGAELAALESGRARAPI